MSRKKEKKKEEPSIWWVIIPTVPLILLFAYSNLVEYGFVDPYAHQRKEMNFTLRGFQYWEDPRWTQERWLVSTYDRGVFYLEGNFTEEQLAKGDTYRVIYKNVLGIGDVPFYYVFTMERVEVIG